MRPTPLVMMVAASVALTGCGTAIGDLTGSGNQARPSPPSSSRLAELTVAAETHAGSYDRDEFEHWEQVEGDPRLPDNCDAREATLYLQGNGVEVDGACETTSGTWTGPYTGATTSDPSEFDIDHMVPLAEAWRSGAHAWSDQRRETFANDLSQLVAAAAGANREKSDQDPASWMPELDRCGYLTHWIAVKTKYDLTVDQAEHDALARELATCPA